MGSGADVCRNCWDDDCLGGPGCYERKVTHEKEIADKFYKAKAEFESFRDSLSPEVLHWAKRYLELHKKQNLEFDTALRCGVRVHTTPAH